ncbi:hypothetical protein UFOVP316_52 [uncultured Caudovirales phage]|uniref:Uncharacterized protein n=1 Tax=uncultured Caudovirales phage TaxID=2100421 RepID=A0A6J5LWU6_9CAUD|nr:hypothetical protein UFOVP316_52 [uncultured Caudovirales phage]
MIQLTKGQTEFIYLTLTEKQTISSPNYLFTFKNRSTNTEVKFVLLFAADVSLFKERYNKFSIKVDKYFSSKPRGQWTYSVYQQTSTSNTDVTGLTLLESGIMWLNDAEEIFTEYQTKDTYKIRQ